MEVKEIIKRRIALFKEIVEQVVDIKGSENFGNDTANAVVITIYHEVCKDDRMYAIQRMRE